MGIVRSIFIPLPDDAAERLRQLAQREMRDPRSQAVWLVLDGLRRAGLGADERPPEDAAATRRLRR